MKVIFIYFSLFLLLSIYSCSREDSLGDNFPLLGKWEVYRTTIEQKLDESLKLDSLKFNIQFNDDNMVFYEQGRVLDSFEYKYYAITDSLLLIREDSSIVILDSYHIDLVNPNISAVLSSVKNNFSPNSDIKSFSTIWNMKKK